MQLLDSAEISFICKGFRDYGKEEKTMNKILPNQVSKLRDDVKDNTYHTINRCIGGDCRECKYELICWKNYRLATVKAASL